MSKFSERMKIRHGSYFVFQPKRADSFSSTRNGPWLCPGNRGCIMSEKHLATDRQTPLLLPPDLRDWVREDVLVPFVIEAMEGMPLSSFKSPLKKCLANDFFNGLLREIPGEPARPSIPGGPSWPCGSIALPTGFFPPGGLKPRPVETFGTLSFGGHAPD